MKANLVQKVRQSSRDVVLAVFVLLLGVAVGACTDPILPAPIPKDPQVGFLATLGDIPLFAARPVDPLDPMPAIGDSFDSTGVKAPHALEADGLFFLYYEGTDGTTNNVSAGIGVAQSSDGGFTFENRQLLLVRRNLAAALVVPSPPRLLDSFDTLGVEHPMVLEDCPFSTPAGGTCLFYSGPGIPDAAPDDDGDGLKEGLGSAIVTPPTGAGSGDRFIPAGPSGISMVTIPPPTSGLVVTQVEANAVPILLANKDLEEYVDPAGNCVSVPCPDDDDFYTELPNSFDPAEEVCFRRSYTPAELSGLSARQLNAGQDSLGTFIGIEAGPYPWESGGISSPYVLRDPRSGRYLMYYTCTEEFGEITPRGCEERRLSRICVAELVPNALGGGRLIARRLLTGVGDARYATPSAPSIPLDNNIVVEGGNFVDANSFDQSGVSDPAVLVSSSVLGRNLYRMWYTGIDENNARRLGITGSFDGFDWDANDAELRVSTIIPSNPILVQAQRAAAPTAMFPSDRILRVYYESITSGTEGSINLSTILELNDNVPPTIEFTSPGPTAIDQGCNIVVHINFEDAGGSGIDQESFIVQFADDLSGSGNAAITRNGIADPAASVEMINGTTTVAVTINQNDDFSDEFPSFRFGASDTAQVELEMQQFRLNPVLAVGAIGELNLRVDIFDRNGNQATNNLLITLVESGTSTTCD